MTFYIGKEPTIGNYAKMDSISAVNGQATYNLLKGGVAFAPQSANHVICSLNSIIQNPGSSFTISGSQITFASNLATGDSIDFILILGDTLSIGVPSDDTIDSAKLKTNSVVEAKIQNNAVTTDKINNDAVTIDKINLISTTSAPSLEAKGTSGQTDGYIQLNCEQNSHGIKLKSPPHSAGQSYTLTFPSTAPATDKFLKTDNSGNLSFADAGGGYNLLSTTSVTNSASIQVGTFSSTYTSYKIILAGLSPESNDKDLYFRFIKADGTEDSSNDYRFTIGGHRGNTYTEEGSESSSSSKWGRNAHNDTGTIASEMLITNPQQSIRTSLVGISSKRFSGNAYAYVETFGCWINGSTSHTAIKFYPASGDWNASGKIMVYGLKE